MKTAAFIGVACNDPLPLISVGALRNHDDGRLFLLGRPSFHRRTSSCDVATSTARRSARRVAWVASVYARFAASRFSRTKAESELSETATQQAQRQRLPCRGSELSVFGHRSHIPVLEASLTVPRSSILRYAKPDDLARSGCGRSADAHFSCSSTAQRKGPLSSCRAPKCLCPQGDRPVWSPG